ncbi:MAG TPA: dihydrofolate reductase family protein, partial [Parvularculaceae bacterium]|nr:dihydrofolate reductase family protein [Parvularculaceae bacterium]
RYQLAISLDGFIAPHDGGLNWLDPYRSLAFDHFNRFIKGIGAVVMGRATYDVMQSMGGTAGFGEMPVAVMTSRPLQQDPEKYAIASRNPAQAFSDLRGRMKKGDIWLMGGADTAARFLNADLIDSIELTVVPEILGGGTPLFSGASPTRFKLGSSKAVALGAIELIYVRI